MMVEQEYETSQIPPSQKAIERVAATITNELELVDSMELHLEYLGISNIPLQLKGMNNVKKLFLSGNRISKVESDDFPRFCNYICLRNNLIKSIDYISFPFNISILDLSYNSLTNFDGRRLMSVVNLKISNNLLESLYFPPMSKIVDASYNKLRTLGDFPWSLHQIELINNELVELPHMNRNLNHINVSFNKIKSFPVFPDNLKVLCISHNDLRVINKPLPKSLDTFKAYASKIDTFLSTLPTTLMTFDVSDNNLEKLPELPNYLFYVYAANNLLKELPDIPNSVKHLDVSNNKLTKIDQALFNDSLVLKCDGNFLDEDSIDKSITDFYNNDMVNKTKVPIPKADEFEVVEKFPGNGQTTGYSNHQSQTVYHGHNYNNHLDKGVDYTGNYGTTYQKSYEYEDHDYGRHGAWKSGYNNTYGNGYGNAYGHGYHNRNYTYANGRYHWVNGNNTVVRNAAYEFRSQRAKMTNPHYVSQLFSDENVVV